MSDATTMPADSRKRRPCQWCGRSFTPRTSGGSEQVFCPAGTGRSCRKDYHDACRRFAERLIASGSITVADLRISGGTPGSPDAPFPALTLVRRGFGLRQTRLVRETGRAAA